VVQRARLPHQVVDTEEQVNGGLGVPQRLGMTAKNPVRVAAPDQQPPRGHAAAAAQYLVEYDQAALCLAGQEQRHAQARQDIGLAGVIPRLARKPERRAKFADGLVDIAEVPEHHADHLMGSRGLSRLRAPRQCVAGGGKRFGRLGQRPGKQFISILRHRGTPVRDDISQS